MEANRCRLCAGENLIEMIDLGRQPIAHRLRQTSQEAEELFPLALHYCADCGLGQICQPIDPELLYRKYNYCFSSWKTEHHMPSEIESLMAAASMKNVFEIACNEGCFLEELKKRNPTCQYVGLEPNEVTSQIARDRGFHVISEMLTPRICSQAVEQFGSFDTVVARQVLEHLTDLDNFFECVGLLLGEQGHLFIDIPDFDVGLEEADCSVIWEEHINYFTESVIAWALRSQGFEICEVQRYNFSGGIISLIARKLSGIAAGRPELRLDLAEQFPSRVGAFGERLRLLLLEHKSKGLSSILYGVGCRACTLVNALGLGEFIDYAIDDQPERQGKYMPGSKLRIAHPAETKNLAGPVICLLAVNKENEEAVQQRLLAVNSDIIFVSPPCPSDIRMEIEKIANA